MLCPNGTVKPFLVSLVEPVAYLKSELAPGDSVLGPRRVPHAFAFVGNTTGKLLVGFTPAGKMEEFFRELEKRGRYFGEGTPEDKKTARQFTASKAWDHPCHPDGARVLISLCGAKTSPSKKRFAQPKINQLPDGRLKLSGFRGGISPLKSACVELSRMLGSVRCIQTPLLAVQMSGSRKCDSAECRSRTISQKAVWTVRSVSHSTSKSN